MHRDLDEQLRLMDEYSFRTVGPIMYEYTSWVLSEAVKRGYKRLYFLARDGYLLCGIANIICARRSIDIECRYLYCSRYSLRMPSYHLIGEEAFDLLLLNGYYVTPKTVLLRAELDEAERSEIYKQLDISDENAVFSDQGFGVFSDALRKNEFYRNIVTQRSKAAYKPAIDYFRQEKLFENDCIAIVDSGWTGSMQRSLRILAESAGFGGKITGFYFGMYTAPKEPCDGEYLCFYFDRDTGLKRKIMFNNNLFECMLSAPHGMTLRYDDINGVSKPIMAEYSEDDMHLLVERQTAGALKFAEEQAEDAPYNLKRSLKTCYRLLKRAMIHPTAEEAEMYSRFMFCDDVTEGYHLSLADKEAKQAVRDNMLVPRVFRKLFRKKRPAGRKPLWVYGLIAGYPTLRRAWCRSNILAWDMLKYMLKK